MPGFDSLDLPGCADFVIFPSEVTFYFAMGMLEGQLGSSDGWTVPSKYILGSLARLLSTSNAF